MKYIALNGFGHSLRRYFPGNRVRCVDRANWTYRNAKQFARSITEPTTIIGFSDGATAALTIANSSEHVVKCYAHSPMFRTDAIRPEVDVTLFRTIGDTTPTYQQAHFVREYYSDSDVPHSIELIDLEMVQHEPVVDVATFFMRRHNHQFRNCLPHLPTELRHGEAGK